MNRLAATTATGIAALGLFFGVACSSTSSTPPPNSSTNTSTSASTGTAATSTATATGTGTAAASQTAQGTQTAPPATVQLGDDLTTAELVKLAEPSVVRIETGTGVGSGFIVSEDGYLVTNNHVIAGVNGRPQTTVSVTLSDGTIVEGTVVGADPRSDLAIVKIPGSNYSALKLADLDDVEIGEDVVAIGYALDLGGGEGPSFTVTRGIVSQKNRAISELSQILGAVQTDAAINHGNSGGPLLRLNGEVVGVNTALQPDASNPSGVAQGIGYAVGSNIIDAVYNAIREDGGVNRGFLGISDFEALRPAQARALGIPEELGGVYLSQAGSVSVSAPAGAAGIRTGDVITKINDIDIRNETDLAVALIEYSAGETVTVEVYRDGSPIEMQVTLGTPPVN